MQEIINCYFKILSAKKLFKFLFYNRFLRKLLFKKFYKLDEDRAIGRAEDIIEMLKENIEYVNNPKNNVDEQWAEASTLECNGLIKEIEEKYPNKDDVILLHNSPMSDYYYLEDEQTLYEELHEYMLEMEDN